MHHEIEVLGFTSIIVSIWFLSGIIITTIGVTGIYVGKIFDQTKNRPVFIIDEIA
jgi:dolichol-phosphate mannosyltransferase